MVSGWKIGQRNITGHVWRQISAEAVILRLSKLIKQEQIDTSLCKRHQRKSNCSEYRRVRLQLLVYCETTKGEYSHLSDWEETLSCNPFVEQIHIWLMLLLLPVFCSAWVITISEYKTFPPKENIRINNRSSLYGSNIEALAHIGTQSYSTARQQLLYNIVYHL